MILETKVLATGTSSGLDEYLLNAGQGITDKLLALATIREAPEVADWLNRVRRSVSVTLTSHSESMTLIDALPEILKDEEEVVNALQVLSMSPQLRNNLPSLVSNQLSPSLETIDLTALALFILGGDSVTEETVTLSRASTDGIGSDRPLYPVPVNLTEISEVNSYLGLAGEGVCQRLEGLRSLLCDPAFCAWASRFHKSGLTRRVITGLDAKEVASLFQKYVTEHREFAPEVVLSEFHDTVGTSAVLVLVVMADVS